MTKSQNTKNEQQKDLCITSEQLTEQWKKGELPSGWYYYKSNILGNIAITDSSTIHKYRNRLDWKDTIAILAPVPSYEELQNMNKAVNECMAANIKLVEENAQLKEYERIVTSYNMKPIDYDIACETVNKLLDERKALKEQNAQLKELLKECVELMDNTKLMNIDVYMQRKKMF